MQNLYAKIMTMIGLFAITGLIIMAAPQAVWADTDASERSLIIGSDEVVVRFPVDGSFVLPEYGVRLAMPEQWRDNVVLEQWRDNVVLAAINVTNGESVIAVYGLLLYPSDITVLAVQYVGAITVYDRALWQGSADIKLGETKDYVFVFRNSRFNQYIGLPQSERYDALMLSDDVAADALKLEILN